MPDFGDLAGKARKFVDEHEEQVDKGIDKAADFAGDKFGHEDQLDKAADKLKGFTGDGEEQQA